MKNLFILLGVLSASTLLGQSFLLEGYTFEVGNRGYLSQVDLVAKDKSTGQEVGRTTSNNDGYFSFDLPPLQNLQIFASKKAFKSNEIDYALSEGKDNKGFLKVEMTRAPGYLFEITLADKKDSIDHVVEAVIGATIEVYNNTTEKEELILKEYPDREFKFNMEKGNHYTILVRKKGYRAKRMEAFVNIKGCILCFEGVNSVRPGVSDNLTSGNEYGTLIANVGMEKVFSGQTLAIEDLYYDVNKWDLKSEAKVELDKVIDLLKYNPNLTLELGSHTDSRGKDEYNKTLSDKRAKSAVKYISDKGLIPNSRIVAIGYGEDDLKNNCYNGVTCSEAKHAENRRTEIKITGINDEWIFKPLVNIKREEKMEQEFFKSSNEVVSEKELQAILEKSNTDKDKAIPEGKNSKDPGMINKMLDKQEEIELPVEKVVLEEAEEFKVNQKEGKKGNYSETSSMVKVEITEDETLLVEEAAPVLEEVKSKEMPKEEVVTEAISALKYKIVVHFTTFPLPETNSLFNKLPDVEEYKTVKRNTLYLMGNYDTAVEANKALKSTYIEDYPNAYIVSFKNGIKVN